jgi:hypothetical protein
VKGGVPADQTAYQAMLKELAVCEFNVGKTELLIETCAAQMADYASLQNSIGRLDPQAHPTCLRSTLHSTCCLCLCCATEGEMQKTQDEIVELQALLQDERTTRSHKEQYAALVSTVITSSQTGGQEKPAPRSRRCNELQSKA